MNKAYKQGFSREDNALICNEGEEQRFIFFGLLDGGEEEPEWGRFKADIQLDENMVFIIHVMALGRKEFIRKDKVITLEDYLLDKEVPISHKQALFVEIGEKAAVNQDDFLLYELSGRYLWFYIEVMGGGKGRIDRIRINIPGDYFMNSYPQIYQEPGSFFHRYLSIFSSIYYDFHEEIKFISSKMNVDRAPKDLLPIFANWLGIDVSGNFLDEETLRTLVKEGYSLNRGKGTKKTLVRAAEILLKDKVIVMEKNKIRGRTQDVSYGKSLYDVVMLIRSRVDEKKKFQLIFLLKQFLPLRCRLTIVYLEEKHILNTHCYLDMNAVLYQQVVPRLNGDICLDYGAVL